MLSRKNPIRVKRHSARYVLNVAKYLLKIKTQFWTEVFKLPKIIKGKYSTTPTKKHYSKIKNGLVLLTPIRFLCEMYASVLVLRTTYMETPLYCSEFTGHVIMSSK